MTATILKLEDPKPYKEKCKKCGNDDIHIQHHEGGDTFRRYNVNKSKENKFVDQDHHGYCKAKKEIITHHCRECGYDWETIPLDVIAKEQIRKSFEKVSVSVSVS